MDELTRQCEICKKIGHMKDYQKLVEKVINKLKRVHSGRMKDGNYICTQCLESLRDKLRELRGNKSSSSSLDSSREPLTSLPQSQSLQTDSSFNVLSQSLENVVGNAAAGLVANLNENVVITPEVHIADDSNSDGSRRRRPGTKSAQRLKRGRLLSTVIDEEEHVNGEVQQNDAEVVANVENEDIVAQQQNDNEAVITPNENDNSIDLTMTDEERQAEARMRELVEARENARIRIRDDTPPGYLRPDDRALQIGNHKRTSGG